MRKCNCATCKYSRGEVSKDYIIGYLQGQVDAEICTFNFLTKVLKVKPSLCAENNTIEFHAACVMETHRHAVAYLNEVKTKGT